MKSLRASSRKGDVMDGRLGLNISGCFTVPKLIPGVIVNLGFARVLSSQRFDKFGLSLRTPVFAESSYGILHLVFDPGHLVVQASDPGETNDVAFVPACMF